MNKQCLLLEEKKKKTKNFTEILKSSSRDTVCVCFLKKSEAFYFCGWRSD